MTPKEKAKQLIDKHLPYSRDWDIERYARINAIENALICIDESIEELKTCETFYKNNSYYGLRINFLNKVKDEINKL